MSPDALAHLRAENANAWRAQRIAFHEMHLARLRHGLDSTEAAAAAAAWILSATRADEALDTLRAAEAEHPAAAYLSLAPGEELAQRVNETPREYRARVEAAARDAAAY